MWAVWMSSCMALVLRAPNCNSGQCQTSTQNTKWAVLVWMILFVSCRVQTLLHRKRRKSIARCSTPCGNIERCRVEGQREGRKRERKEEEKAENTEPKHLLQTAIQMEVDKRLRAAEQDVTDVMMGWSGNPDRDTSATEVLETFVMNHVRPMAGNASPSTPHCSSPTKKKKPNKQIKQTPSNDSNAAQKYKQMQEKTETREEGA